MSVTGEFTPTNNTDGDPQPFECFGGPLDGFMGVCDGDEVMVLSGIQPVTVPGCPRKPEPAPWYRYVLRGREDGMLLYDFQREA